MSSMDSQGTMMIGYMSIGGAVRDIAKGAVGEI